MLDAAAPCGCPRRFPRFPALLVVTAAWLMFGSAPLSAHTPGQRNVGFEPRAFAIVKARLVISPDEEIEQGTLVIRDGLIVAAGADPQIPPDAEIIDGSGLIVYPGFIDAATSSLLDGNRVPAPTPGRPIDFSRFALAATPPDNRKSLTPEFLAHEGLKSDAALVEARRKLGFTTLHHLPTGRIASGQGSLITTSGLPLRESALATETSSQFQLFAPGGPGYPATLMGAITHLRQAFLDGERYREHQKLYQAQVAGISRPPEDPVLEALNKARERSAPAIFVAQSLDDIHRTLDFSAEHNLRVALWGGREAHRAIPRLREQSQGVIVQLNWGAEPAVEANPTGNLLDPKWKDPVRAQEDRRDRWRQQVAGLKQLYEGKVRFALSSEGLQDPGEFWKGVRQAIAAGLPRQAALSALTRDAALLLGQERRLGTLAAGKLAHIVVLNGPFDDERSKVRLLFVDGLKFEYNRDAGPVPPPSAAQPAPSDLTGAWQVEIEAADGKFAATLDLKQNAATLAGTFDSPQGAGKIASGKVDGPLFEFVVAIGAGAQTIELKFSGSAAEAKDGRINGSLKSAFGAATKWTAVRKAVPATPANPVSLRVDDSSNDDGISSGHGKEPVALPPGDWPTELDSDRLQRPLQTGGNLLVRNATVFTGLGEPLPETSILIRDGKIAAIGHDVTAEGEIAVIDASGKFVMPGIIDTHSHIMFADGMSGVNEATLSIVPEVRVRDVVRTEDPAAYRALAGGVTAARLFHGSANVIGGQDAVVKLKFGEPASRQLLHGNPQGVKFALGENVKFQTNRFPNTRLGVEATLQRAFLEALDYRRQWMEYRKATALAAAGDNGSGTSTNAANATSAARLAPRRDLRLEALADIIDQQKFIHSHCYRADEILMLLRVASGFGVRVWSLQHVLEGYKIAPEIAAHGASCSTFADWWAYKVEAFDATPYNAALLAEAGVNIVLKSDDAELMRHLYQDAAKMIRYGSVAPDAALRMITLNSARELGLANRMGSIEVGKDGDLAIFSGHPLNAFSRCETTIIDGDVYFIRDRQPSTMSGASAAATGQPGNNLPLPSSEIRERKVDVTTAASGRYALVGGTIHPVDGPDVVGGTLLIDGNRIAALGSDVTVPEDAKRLDISGLHIYPGMIDAGTVLGLIEIGKVRETHDYNEAGLFQPDLRAGVAVNPDSELIPVTRAGGITATLVRPTGGIISGQASLMKLDGWTVPEMVLDFEAGLYIDWPSGNDNQGRIDQLRDFLNEGRTYFRLKQTSAEAKVDAPIQDPRYESLIPYLKGEKRIFIEANSRKEIAEALLFAEKEKLQITISGGADAWKLAEELKKRNIPVIVGAVMAKPFGDFDPFDASYANPGRLHEAGVSFCIRSNASSTAGFSASNSRNAPFEAAQAVAYGLPEAEGLKSVTLYPARILGVEDRMGSLTTGKLANLLITDGSPLQPATKYKAIFVSGKPYAPESRHTRLYEKYRGRLLEHRNGKK